MRYIPDLSLMTSSFRGRTESDVFRFIVPFFITICLLATSSFAQVTASLAQVTASFDQVTAIVPLTPLAKPVEMLDAAGVDASFRVYLIQGKPWDVLENETLVKILHRLPDFPRLLIERWAFPWEGEERQALVADPEAWQGQFFRLRFTVLTLRKITLPVEAVRRFGFSEYFEVQVELTDGSSASSLATIFVRAVPGDWASKTRTDAPVRIDEPGSAIAMFLKTGDVTDRSSTSSAYYFAADRLAWHPKTTAGQLGMDVGLFDLIHDRQRIDGKEREPFYQLLDAVSRAEPSSLRKTAAAELGKDKDGRQNWTTAAALFNRPEQMRGQLVLLTGNVRRALRIEVRDPDIIERFGIRHYYELYLFTQDSQDNPIIVCVCDLPKNMPIGSGPDYCEPIEVAGIMFKSWAFTPEETARDKSQERQLAPLVIGRKPVWLQSSSRDAFPWTGPIVTTCLVIGFFLLWYFLRRQATADRVAKKRRQASDFSVE